ncbi:A/G-specific adenine glycosylase [Tomitella fengzijianii]|uniref:Adenine DNA glycosylase n=1 Tax=Tomitella fengzijianii TaxID=2597660 RepID=A0A516X073_9ACTN|nr:A/G-specific adenine glycosylase [Tomitella fengzijianii]QDQ96499.1 A/G-specific adenine glycosylase [Tomitella fengzijianii]
MNASTGGHGPAGELSDWYAAHGRDLPWRRAGTDAWRILLSEVMLQQTPVARVLPVWERWARRWPAPSDMASATAGEVLREWGSLGYPRRALRLHECAGILAREHDDTVPGDVETLLRLPGIGAYTARAIACFAYGQRVPVVDINVRRVVARTVHGRGDPGPPSTRRDLEDVAELLPAGDADASRFSAALMEFGALTCTARAPACGTCPLTECRWRALGFPAYEGPKRTTQKFEGTDRQARGRLMAVLRAAQGPVARERLDVAWTRDPAQRDRALGTLLTDGLIEQTPSGEFALPGEH